MINLFYTLPSTLQAPFFPRVLALLTIINIEDLIHSKHQAPYYLIKSKNNTMYPPFLYMDVKKGGRVLVYMCIVLPYELTKKETKMPTRPDHDQTIDALYDQARRNADPYFLRIHRVACREFFRLGLDAGVKLEAERARKARRTLVDKMQEDV